MTAHRLKTSWQYFDATKNGMKLFEVRKNDRGFQRGDLVELIRCSEIGIIDNPTESLLFEITYVLQGGQFGLDPAYCVLGLKRLGS